MNPESALAHDLHQHIDLCQEILTTVQAEARELADPATASPAAAASQTRRRLLPRLKESIDRLRRHRVGRDRLSPAERSHPPAIARLLQQTQDLTLRAIVLDRENEQTLLRRGLLPPGQLPAAHRQRPHFVAELYRRHGGTV